MDFSFLLALRELGPEGIATIARDARTPEDYLFAQFLPNDLRSDYQAESGNMTIRTTMAGLVGMDSPYPEVGTSEASTFSEKTAKIAGYARLTERELREMQAILLRLAATGNPTNDYITTVALNFLNKVIVQSLLDTEEWLRAQALITGEIDWTFNRKRLLVNYGIPTGNFLPTRTGNDAYHGNASKFWPDIRLLRKALGGNVRAFVAHPETLEAAFYNPVNQMAVIGETNEFVGPVTFRRMNNDGTAFTLNEATDRITIIGYGSEGEVFDPANPGRTLKLPYVPLGKLAAFGRNDARVFRVGEGATPDVNADNPLGYTHVAPTTEGGGVPGRWAQLFTPENLPMQLHGRGAENLLPVIESPEKIAVSTTAMPA